MHNTRTEKRTPLNMKVEYAFESSDLEKKDAGPRETFTSDISYSGMGLYAECPAEAGQVIKIFLRHVFMEPVMAEVRWCKKDRASLYRIGVRFI